MKKEMQVMTMGLMALIVVAGIVYAVQGVNMQNRVAAEETKFHALQEEYYTISKTERDAAATGSELNRQLVEIKNYPSTLLELKLVGVGKILTGIFVVLFGILIALIMMPKRLGMIIKENK